MKNKAIIIPIIIGICAICSLVFFLIWPSFFQEKSPILKTPIVKTFDTIPILEPNQNQTENIRQSAVAGQFYPESKAELEQMINNHLNQADLKNFNQTPQIIIVPHAGYIYSGKVAAYAYKALLNSNFERVILIGRSHTAQFNGIAADTNEIWQTPLGELKVDQEFIDLLPVIKDSTPHEKEHSLEVQIPFLIRTFGTSIKIVPLLFGNENPQTIKSLADSLGELIDKNTLIVISTDLSHYPSYEDANNIDNQAIKSILSNDIEQFRNKIAELEKLNTPNTQTLACAQPAVETAIILSQNLGFEPTLLKYANSGDYFEDLEDRVVGYAAITYTGLIESEDITKRELNLDEQKIALEIARKTLKNHFNKTSYKPSISDYPIFQLKRGAFVTLKINNQLRGCMGNFEPEQTLVQVIQETALLSAFNDPRFLALTKDEFENIEIEISILSPREQIFDHNLIEVGKHGVYIQKRNKAGTYLPQVATENNWTKEEFLQSLCVEKTQIGPDCWLDPETNIYIYTAQIFDE